MQSLAKWNIAMRWLKKSNVFVPIYSNAFCTMLLKAYLLRVTGIFSDTLKIMTQLVSKRTELQFLTTEESMDKREEIDKKSCTIRLKDYDGV